MICQQESSFRKPTEKLRSVIPRLLKGHDQYLKWLAELVECINSAHNPSVPGK